MCLHLSVSHFVHSRGVYPSMQWAGGVSQHAMGCLPLVQGGVQPPGHPQPPMQTPPGRHPLDTHTPFPLGRTPPLQLKQAVRILPPPPHPEMATEAFLLECILVLTMTLRPSKQASVKDKHALARTTRKHSSRMLTARLRRPYDLNIMADT